MHTYYIIQCTAIYLCILITMQECLQLLQLLHTELSDSKEQVKKLELQLQQLQVCNLHIELCSLCTYISTIVIIEILDIIKHPGVYI